MTSTPGVRAGDTRSAPPFARALPHRRPSGEPPPLPRKLNKSGKYWLTLALVVVSFGAIVATTSRTGVVMDVVDHQVLVWLSELRMSLITDLMLVVGWLASSTALVIAWWISLVIMIVWRRWRHLIVWVIAMLIVSNLALAGAQVIQRPRPLDIEILGPWHGFAMPSAPMAVLAATIVNVLYALVPGGRPRQIGKVVGAVVLAAVAVSRLYLAQDTPTDVVFGVILGVAIPLALFRLFAPNDVFPVTYHRGRKAHLDVTGERGAAIKRALREQIGLLAVDVQPFGLEGSGGSTPLRVSVEADSECYVFSKLYAATHLRSDRWYKLGRTMLYGRLEDESAFNTVRRLVQYEDYLLRLLYGAGLPVPEPYGIVEITPEREYLLVTQFFDGAREIGDSEVDDDIIDQGLLIVRKLWDAGLAHRDIKPANLLVRNGQLILIDSAFAEVRPSPWRQAVDLANMMLVLALRTDVQRVYGRAKLVFTEDEIAEAFAATRGITMPTQLRRMMRQQGRRLHEEFRQLPPTKPKPIRIQRWSWRRVGLLIGAATLAGLTIAIAIPLLGSPL
ncbi:MAG TPA: phosphatase PAP2 family protein [Actinomycetes bacterium]|nr:phosphatase PAP2 family protein [Actinomycetes bacterium]